MTKSLPEELKQKTLATVPLGRMGSRNTSLAR